MAINEYGQGGGGGGGASTFDDLTDTPAMDGQAGKIVKINSTEDGLVYESGGTGGGGGWDDSASGIIKQDNTTDKVGMGTVTAPATTLDVGGQVMALTGRGHPTYGPGSVPLVYRSGGDSVFDIDPQMSNAQLAEFFNEDTGVISWDETEFDAPGGYAIKITGKQKLGGFMGGGFPMIPIEDQEGQTSGDATATYFGEIWIKNVGDATANHYVGSTEFAADFSAPGSGSGNPGIYGYWTAQDVVPGTSWVKYSGYVSGYHDNDPGTFETGASYFSPFGWFNYNQAETGETDYCIISGWRIWRVSHAGKRTFGDDLRIDGTVHVAEEQGAAPTAPASGAGGILYTKADGKPYWISDDVGETDLTTAGGGGGGGGSTLSCQAAAPNSPALGDFWYETDRNIFYSRIEDSAGTAVWLDLSTAGGGGGGGGGGWIDDGTTVRLDAATDKVAIATATADTNAGLTIDTTASLKAQSSTPTDTTGYAHFFAKDVVAAGTAAEVLYHFNDNVEDASTNENDGTATGVTYSTSGAGGDGASGFDKAAVFDGSDYVLIDDIDIGTSDMTCEFWVNFDVVSTSASDNNCIVSEGQSTDSSTAGAGYFAIIVSSGVLKAFYWDGSGPVSDTFTMSGTFVANTWYHVAYVRSSTAHSLYVGTAGNASGARVATWTHTAYAVGGAGDDWQIGRMRDGTYSTYNLNGELDELLISKEARYSGTTYTLPTAPYSTASGTTTHIYARNSNGGETLIV